MRTIRRLNSNNSTRNIRKLAISESSEELGGSGEGDIPWKNSESAKSSNHTTFSTGGNQSAGKVHDDKGADMPTQGDDSKGTTKRTNIEGKASKRTASLAAVVEDWIKENNIPVEVLDVTLTNDYISAPSMEFTGDMEAILPEEFISLLKKKVPDVWVSSDIGWATTFEGIEMWHVFARASKPYAEENRPNSLKFLGMNKKGQQTPELSVLQDFYKEEGYTSHYLPGHNELISWLPNETYDTQEEAEEAVGFIINIANEKFGSEFMSRLRCDPRIATRAGSPRKLFCWVVITGEEPITAMKKRAVDVRALDQALDDSQSTLDTIQKEFRYLANAIIDAEQNIYEIDIDGQIAPMIQRLNEAMPQVDHTVAVAMDFALESRLFFSNNAINRFNEKRADLQIVLDNYANDMDNIDNIIFDICKAIKGLLYHDGIAAIRGSFRDPQPGGGGPLIAMKKKAQTEEATLAQMVVDFLNSEESHLGLALAGLMKEMGVPDPVTAAIEESIKNRNMHASLGSVLLWLGDPTSDEGGSELYAIPESDFLIGYTPDRRYSVVTPDRTVEAMYKQGTLEENIQIFEDYAREMGAVVYNGGRRESRARPGAMLTAIMLHIDADIYYGEGSQQLKDFAQQLGFDYAYDLGGRPNEDTYDLEVIYYIFDGEQEDMGMEKEAVNLKVDNNLRGSVNYIVESEPNLSWKDIDSIEYVNVPKHAVKLDEFPRSLREDGIVIFHANNPKLKAQGLQHVEGHEFPDNAVMVFYKTGSTNAFHMRNVKFPLEILFTDEDFIILDKKNMDMGTNLYYPPKGAIHAVEAKIGWSSKRGLKVGDVLYLDRHGVFK